MEGLERAKLKDSILLFLLEKGGGWGEDGIYLGLGKPTKTENHISEILNEMNLEASKYFYYNDDDGYVLVSANDFTQEFLDKGGFVSEYNKQVVAARKLNENIKRENNVKELKEIDLKLNIRNSKFALPLSIISILIALGSIFLPKLEKENDGQLKAIQERMDYLEGILVKENDSMRLVIDKIKDTIK
ncbi:hypothetical protein F8C76_11255 [Flagellimonas olearia]|uniref:Uncharacterized protein n=1 Tax=Flagellimonas olearia TaxID=552546 RepID=A0A6I1DYM1_9FLAO|nr:hypothetical protein [Allomuricauda olearia]KAB7528433.1 hypothetical protein F8C76_11255 [Allomuricauda olearia]